MDKVYKEILPLDDEKVLAMEYLPGQFDQRADSAKQCIQILIPEMESKVKTAKVIILKGEVCDFEYNRIREYWINPVDSREASMDTPPTLSVNISEPNDIVVIEGFIYFNEENLEEIKNKMGLAMSLEDLSLIRDYFANEEKRNPTITEIKVIDTYWSDHCRHTTFLTEIHDIQIEDGPYKKTLEDALSKYLSSREKIKTKNPITLMDLATINLKESKQQGNLQDLDISDEINACSIEVDVNIGDEKEKWLLMFKNETHNHPTEIEPFGGAATCLGGAIRDPLSGRSYVYQAMRISGSGDPRKSMDETLPGKLPQRKISKEAAKGYSSYGNQIGIATGQVVEIYHEGYVAKRMEVGAVIAAAPKENVIREKPKSGDIVLLVGGKTGRDGIGGATGSSKSHTEESLVKSGAEVQKGNAPEERKIQRLFRNSKVSKLIKRCNDFGAGGVSVAIGELSESLTIDLDVVPKKYEGLDGTELAISESQERMAVVIESKDLEAFIKYGNEENLEVTKIAEITDNGRLVMKWRNKIIFDISRKFLDTNGAKQYTKVKISSTRDRESERIKEGSFKNNLIEKLQDLNICSQQGLIEMFDSTVGASTVLMPLGGKYKITPAEGMVAKLPVLKGDTNTCSLMSYGFDPEICQWSPYHGGINSVVEAAAKIVAMGGDYKKIRLSMQEYFEKSEDNPVKWGKPFSALLGAYMAQSELGIAAIGGKDSMSGTFKDKSVPPTIIAFAVTTDITENILSPEFKKENSIVYLAEVKDNNNDLPDFKVLKETYESIKALVDKKVILAAKTVSKGGIATAIAKMSFGNKIGFEFEKGLDLKYLFENKSGSIILEIQSSNENLLPSHFRRIGKTTSDPHIEFNNEIINIDEMILKWQQPLLSIYPTRVDTDEVIPDLRSNQKVLAYRGEKISRPRVFIPIFPGTNSEYDSIKAFEKAGAAVTSIVFRNKSADEIQESLKSFSKEIFNSQILMIPGGFSAGDEPDGSGKFIATVFRNPYIAEAIMDLIKRRDGLILGICNGFQALIKLGLLPYGEIRPLDERSPTLTFNKIGRHISHLSATRVASKLSPWFNNTKLGDIYSIPLSHGEGRFVAEEEVLQELIKNGQIATQYAKFNPNGSAYAVEGITSPDGRVLGKMGHSERSAKDIYKNIPGNKHQDIFNAGVDYFK